MFFTVVGGECLCKSLNADLLESRVWWSNCFSVGWGKSLCWRQTIVNSSEDCMTLFNGEI